MSPLPLLKRLSDDLSPDQKIAARVKRCITGEISAPERLHDVRKALTPSVPLRKSVWKQVLRKIDVTTPLTLLDQVKEILSPASNNKVQTRDRLFARIVPGQAFAWQYRMKWVAAVAVFLILVKASPLLFVAPTIASSEVILIPTRGEVYVSMGELWQPVTEELVLEPGMQLKTDFGEASILFRDNGVVRLDQETIVTIHDTASRNDPVATVLPTLTLYTGRLWVQGLIPPHRRGLTVSTTYGSVSVNEGSVSIAEDDLVDVRVFDRRATVRHETEEIVLVTGEKTQLWEKNVPLAKRLSNKQYAESWPAQNLARDAVHRREIAQLQHERRAAAAGILPTSPFYTMKRFAEEMDVFLTFNENARVEKRLAQANSRLNEAAALLNADQQEDATATLLEYRSVLVALAGESDDGSVVQMLIEEALMEASTDTAAALPDDDAYALRQAVLEAGAHMDGSLTADFVQGMLLADTLDALSKSIENGNVAGVQDAWQDLQPHLALLENSSTLQPDVQKELRALLTRFALAVDDSKEKIGLDDSTMLTEVAVYLPPEPDASQVLLTEEQLSLVVQGIRDRIFLYHMTRSRLNQLVAELKAIKGHPEEGRILRRLYLALPTGPENFPDRMSREITRLRWEKAGEVL